MAEVVERLERTETVVTADFRGLTVAQLAELRQRLREAEAEMTVVKNTLSRRAVDETGRAGLRPYLDGPTGLVWIDGDPARAAKALSDFAKAHQDVFTIRGGVLGGDDLPAESIVRLASLPPREQMLAQLAGGLLAPLSGLAGTLNSLIGTLARTLAAVSESGALAAGTPPEPVAVDTPPSSVTEEEPVEEAPTEETTPDAPAEEAAAPEASADVPAAEAAPDEAPAPDAPPDEATPDGPADDTPDAGDGVETPES